MRHGNQAGCRCREGPPAASCLAPWKEQPLADVDPVAMALAASVEPAPDSADLRTLPEPEPKAPEAAPAPKPKAKEKFHGAPAGFRADQAKKLAPPAPVPRPDLPGGQIPAKDFFKPDQTEQGELEVVRLTRSRMVAFAAFEQGASTHAKSMSLRICSGTSPLVTMSDTAKRPPGFNSPTNTELTALLTNWGAEQSLGRRITGVRQPGAQVGLLLHIGLLLHPRRQRSAERKRPLPAMDDAQARELVRSVRNVRRRRLRPLHHLVSHRHRYNRGSCRNQVSPCSPNGGDQWRDLSAF